MKHNRGFTLIELLVSMAVMALIAIPLFDILRGAFETFNRGTDSLIVSADLHNTTPDLGRNLEYSNSIQDVSLRSNTTGYLQYIDAEDRTITLFQNTLSNQGKFSATNIFPTSNIVVVYTEGGSDTSPEILVPNISLFQIETYEHSSTSIASANNITSVSTSNITSLQFRLDATDGSASDKAEFLIRLSRTPIENGGEHTYGIVGAPFTDLDFNNFTHSNIDTTLDGSGGEADGIYLLTPTLETVKIKNTGQYYSSIQAAVDAAASGDTIMVGHRDGGYVENVYINGKSNITILGGYNSETWIRNPEEFPTELTNRGGFSIDDITAAFYIKDSSECHIDQIEINGNDLRHALYVFSSYDISLMHLSVTSADRSVILSQSSVNFAHNEVTGNEYALFVTSTEPVLIERSRFFSFDITNRESTLTLENAGNTVIRNSLILGGYNGIHMNNSTAITLQNSVIDLPENFGIFVQSSTGSTIQNSAICNGTIGLVVSPDDPGKNIEYNYYLNQQARASDPPSISEEANSYTTGSTVLIEVWRTSNSFFENIIDYIPLAGSPGLVDSGTGSQDLSDFDAAKGTSVNDVGLYGGQSAGRVGPSSLHEIVSTNTQAEITAILSNSWPGDMIFIGSGTYPLTASLPFKTHQTIVGAGPMDTVISSGVSPIVSLENGSSLSYIMLEGDASNTGIQMAGSGDISVTNTVLKDLNLGIDTTGASGLISFSTFYDATTGFRQAGSSRSTLNLCIFANPDTAIENDNTSDAVTGYYNLFHNRNLLSDGLYSGTGDQSQGSATPLFWDEDNNLLQLAKDSTAIDRVGNYDAGAFEYFELEGFALTPEYESALPRDYDQIEISVGGVSELSAPMSEIEVAYILGDASVTLSPTVIVSRDITFSHVWDLPPNVITEKLKVKVKMTSYTPGKTPYLNELKVIW